MVFFASWGYLNIGVHLNVRKHLFVIRLSKRPIKHLALVACQGDVQRGLDPGTSKVAEKPWQEL